MLLLEVVSMWDTRGCVHCSVESRVLRIMNGCCSG